ncbi:SDR family oxidoreductase [Kitasatospora sp. LaBMicrA B282]|uniref:SDR family oxidoreductase n=1 Tax=Kitasatospora sp. LaBMicrA B282 TaxID=3420949 RepID=UPI003D0CEA03
MTVLVTGSRGKVGSLLVHLLVERGVPVRAGSSAPDELTLPAGAEPVRLSLTDPATFPAALAGVSSVFLYCEPAHIDEFIEAAKAAGVEHLVLMSADAVLRPGAEQNSIARPHWLVEQAVKASGLAWTVLNPGSLASNAGSWKYVLKARGAVTLPFPDAYADPTYEPDVAEAAFAALTRPEVRGRNYHLTGPQTLTFREQVAVISEVTGRDIPVQAIPPSVWLANRPGFIPEDIAIALIEYWSTCDKPVPLSRDFEILIGRPCRPFRAWAEDHAAAFAAA